MTSQACGMFGAHDRFQVQYYYYRVSGTSWGEELQASNVLRELQI